MSQLRRAMALILLAMTSALTLMGTAGAASASASDQTATVVMQPNTKCC